jgi:hypothetical protein
MPSGSLQGKDMVLGPLWGPPLSRPKRRPPRSLGNVVSETIADYRRRQCRSNCPAPHLPTKIIERLARSAEQFRKLSPELRFRSASSSHETT